MKTAVVRKVGLLTLAAALSAPAMADGLNYNYIEAAYLDTEIDDIEGQTMSEPQQGCAHGFAAERLAPPGRRTGSTAYRGRLE